MTSANQDETLYIDRLEGEDIEVPDVEWPADLPVAERLSYYNEQLLDANGYEPDMDGWRRAVTSKTEIIREAGVQIPARKHVAADEPLFRQGLADSSAIVRAWSAWGLIQLGDDSRRSVLDEIAAREPEFGWHAPFVAASLLGELGQARAWQRFMASWDASSERYVLLSYALPFIALHGQEYAPGKNIDIWELYRRALADPDENTRYAALEHLAEYKPEAARPLLEEFLTHEHPAYQSEMARRILAGLPR